MKYIGIATQQRNNNIRSLFLLVCFPLLIFLLLYAGCFSFFYVANYTEQSKDSVPIIAMIFSILPRIVLVTVAWFIIAYFIDVHIVVFAGVLGFSYIGFFVATFITSNNLAYAQTNTLFLKILPYAALAVFLWFVIAYFVNVCIINSMTHSHTLERRKNKRVYNLVENLCISCGMSMPRVNVIEDSALNAFASGINRRTYTITLTRGIIDTLDDSELEGVIAHELSHIRNNDVKVLIISIVFVGFFDMLMELCARSLKGGKNRRGKKEGGGFWPALFVLIFAALGYGVSLLMRFAISRNREYMADAGAAELTKNPKALASALRKISGKSHLNLELESVSQLFIEHKPYDLGFFAKLYQSHPPIEERIGVLMWF